MKNIFLYNLSDIFNHYLSKLRIFNHYLRMRIALG